MSSPVYISSISAAVLEAICVPERLSDIITRTGVNNTFLLFSLSWWILPQVEPRKELIRTNASRMKLENLDL